MCRINCRLKLYALADPAKLFSVEDFSESFSDACVRGTYFLQDISGEDAYLSYGKLLSDHNFCLRLSLEHASVWVKNALSLVMEYGELKGREFFRIVFLKAPKQQRIYFETNKSKLFESDFKMNSEFSHEQHFKPYYLRLSYTGIDFSNLNFRRVFLRFADLFGCNFKNTSWHACRFHLPYDGRDLFCQFVNCDFSGSFFLGADFSRCQFYNCNFSGTHFRNCKLEGTIFDSCLFEDFDMVRCKTENMFFLYSNLGGEEDA